MSSTVIKTDSFKRTRTTKATLDNWNSTISDFQDLGNSVSVVTKIYGDSEPDWRNRLKQGANATTNMSVVSVGKYHYVPGQIQVDGIPNSSQSSKHAYTLGYVITLVGYFGGLVIYTSSSKADSEALGRFYADLDRKVTKFQGLVFLGELRETLHMIRHPAKALRERTSDFLSHVSKRAPRVSRRRRKEFISDSYLEYAFGVRPLINDIDQGMKALQEVQRPQHEMVRGFGKSEDDRIVGPIQVNYVNSLNGALCVEWGVRRQELNHKKYYGVVESSGYGVPYDLHTFGIDLENLLPSVWELIPYSFLVDYFTNIGTIISAASYRQIQPIWVSSTDYKLCHWYSISHKVKLSNPSFNGLYTVGGSPGSADYQLIEISRVRDAELHLPYLEVSVPGFGDLRWANISALGAQWLSSRKAVRS